MSVRIVVMGPSGSGKSTVGRAVARSIGAHFVDGDDLHSQENVAKMAGGLPLDDDDRMPWLRAVGDSLHEQDRIVVACSALRRAYRDVIRSREPEAFFAELAVGRATLEERMRLRADHFMPASLLDSQLQTLEPLGPDERGIRIDESADVAEAVALVGAAIGADQSLR